MENTVCDSHFLRGGGTIYHAGPHGETPGSVERHKEEI